MNKIKPNFINLLIIAIVFSLVPNLVQAETTGTIWGYKVKMPGNQFGQTPPSGETMTVDGSTSTANPFNFGSLSADNHTVTVTVPTGWSVGYTLCYNETSCHGNTPTAGNSVIVNVPGGGYADLWWHYSYSTGMVQGYKLDHLGNLFNNPGATISIGNQTLGAALNPYSTTTPAGSTIVQSSVPQGYDVYYSVCTNCFNHPASSYVKGTQATITVPDGGYADLYWKYVTPSLVNFSLPSSTTLKQILSGSLSTEIYQGYANIYAPEVLYDNGVYKMWYGGGGIDIRDRIHYAESTDSITWVKKGAAIEAPSGSFNANDPSVLKVGGKYYMYMTISEGNLLDNIYLSTSNDGSTWTTPTKILDKGPYSWNSRYTARPTVIYDNGMFKMWYDTTTGTNFSDPVTDINVGYATSADGVSWQKHDQIVFKGYAANDVKKIQGTYVMLIQGAWEGTLIATSLDGINWTKKGTLIPPDSGNASQILGHLTPSLFIDPITNKPKTIYLGAGVSGSSLGYDRNAIYMYSLKDGELEKFLTTTSTITPAPSPTPTPTPTPSPTPSPVVTPTPIAPSTDAVRLIDDKGTYYLIQDNQKLGITNPGMLYSYGFEFKDAEPAASSDLSLPSAELLLPGNGSLVKSPTDSTVWLISNNKKYGFVSGQVFTDLGFKFSTVLVVTAPELEKLAVGSLLSETAVPHLDGVDINDNGTIYWLSGGKKYGYPSMEVYNSWHRDNDFSQVVPANSADKALPYGGTISTRVLY